MALRQNSRRAYRVLLRAYPAEFRHEYGAEMACLFASRLETEPSLRLWLEIIPDLLLTASREHLHILLSDLRHGFHALSKKPGFVFAALLTIVLGVSATTVVFSLINAVLIRSLPYQRPERLAYVWTPLQNTSGIEKEISPLYEDVLAWQKTSRSFEAITAVQRYAALLNGHNAERVSAARVFGNFFNTLGARPQLGRAIEASDDRVEAPLVAVISDALWRTKFAGDTAALGKTLYLNRHAYQVIGVMPPDFSYPHGNDFPGQYQYASMPRTDVWVPASITPKERLTPDFGFDAAIGRLRRGATWPDAQAELSAIQRRLAAAHPASLPDRGMLLAPLIDTLMGHARPLLSLLMGAVCLVLCMAAGNLASLLMARASERLHEMGVRTALGAERSRLIRLLITESVMLSVLGGAIAIPVSYQALKLLVNLNPGDIPRFEEVTLDQPVLSFGLTISLVTGVVAGLLPALSASAVSVNSLLRQGGRGSVGGSLRARDFLIMVQVGLSVVLLAAAGLMLRSYLFVQSEEKGFAASTLTMSVQFDPQTKTLDRIRRELMDRIRSLPGVVAAGSIDDLPLSTAEDKGFLEIEGRARPTQELASVRTTAGEYFRAMQIPLLSGRYLNDRDIPPHLGESWPSSVAVSASFSARHFNTATAIGHRLRINKSRWATIVGVVGDVRHAGLESAPEPTIYIQNGEVDVLVVRSAQSPTSLTLAIKQTVRAFDPNGVLADIQTMSQYVDHAAAHRKFQTVALASFALLSVLLVLMGLWGLLSFAVQHRRQEISIRMTVGASRASIMRMIILYGLKLASVGLLVGILAAVALSHTLSAFLYGVRAFDPITFITVPLLILVLTFIACGVPARKAAGIDPLHAWRGQ